MKIQKMQSELIAKEKLLKEAECALKKEFIGIDNVINEVTGSISSWFMLPEIQEKPLVVNLWGLTGVGKSSLIRRLSELLNMRQSFFHFDLGENLTGRYSLKARLEEIYRNANGKPAIIAFDEFQFARTLSPGFVELDQTNTRAVWDILDTGRIDFSDLRYSPDSLYRLITRLKHMLKIGVKVVNGRVVSRVKEFDEEIQNLICEDYTGNEFGRNRTHRILFVPEYYKDLLYWFGKDRFESEYDVRARLREMSGEQTVEFLTSIYEDSKQPRILDCTKSLIFVLGNLDEAYSMSLNFNPDLEADEFHDQTKKITVPAVKKALRGRFRSEQIARLGSNHIIFPAFSKDTFREIVALELRKISGRFFESTGIGISFDETVHELIYKEGVFPTQGTRPVFSTIERIITARLSKLTVEMILNNVNADELLLSWDGSKFTAEYINRKETVHKLSFTQQLNLEKLRECRRDDEQAITAVHESGHAVLCIFQLGIIPERIFSTTADTSTGGMTYARMNSDHVSKAELVNRLSVFLGGLAAEQLVFGEENTTTGAQDDIQRATEFLLEMLKCCGMGEIPLAINADTEEARFYLHVNDGRIDTEAEQLIKRAMDNALSTLAQHEELLLTFADYLSDNCTLERTCIEEFVNKYLKFRGIPHDAIQKKSRKAYRHMLKEKINRFGVSQLTESRD